MLHHHIEARHSETWLVHSPFFSATEVVAVGEMIAELTGPYRCHVHYADGDVH